MLYNHNSVELIEAARGLTTRQPLWMVRWDRRMDRVAAGIVLCGKCATSKIIVIGWVSDERELERGKDEEEEHNSVRWSFINKSINDFC